MASVTALRRCPSLVFVPPRFDVYRAVSQQIRAIFADYTDLIDRLAAPTVWLTGGCDSWYLDPRSGRLTLLWPGSATAFRERSGTVDPAPYETEGARATLA